jgi:hypothetical protein
MKTGNLKTLSAGVAAISAAMLMGYQAQAGFYTVGDPVGIGSWGQGQTWYQTWAETGIGPFDQIEAIARPASAIFADPALANFSDGSWQNYPVDATHAVGYGPSVSTLQFDTFFTISPSSSFTFDLYAWNGNTLADSVRATWTGSTWTYGTADQNVTRTMVPEPTALLLLPLGALAFGAWRRRTA